MGAPDPASPLIGVAELHAALAADPPTLLDVRWSLGGPPGRDEYEAGHLPEARFVDLERELSGPPGAGGRHPLPDAESFGAAMRAHGVSPRRAVVVYDAGGALSAARAWWLLRYYGHPDVRVLDGGVSAWLAAGHELSAEPPRRPPPGDFVPVAGGLALLDAAGATALARDGVLLDARAPERFRGELEPLDPVAGHIPGAINHPAALYLAPDRRFRAAREVRGLLERDGVRPDRPVGAYCGSGITAAQTVLVLQWLGYRAALYAGSWSEWVTDPARPVATGP